MKTALEYFNAMTGSENKKHSLPESAFMPIDSDESGCSGCKTPVSFGISVLSELNRSYRHMYRFSLLVARLKESEYRDIKTVRPTNVVSLIRKGLRAEDTWCRLGDGRILALLPHTGKAGAWRVAERIAAELADNNFGQSGPFCVSDSFFQAGIAVYPNDGDTYLRLRTTAEARLSERYDSECAMEKCGGNRLETERRRFQRFEPIHGDHFLFENEQLSLCFQGRIINIGKGGLLLELPENGLHRDMSSYINLPITRIRIGNTLDLRKECRVIRLEKIRSIPRYYIGLAFTDPICLSGWNYLQDQLQMIPDY